MSDHDYGWRPYVSVATRRRRAAQTVAKLQRSGRVISPVTIEGRKIARTFWGESWCRNLEAYSDYVNRLPRGRAYVRNGSVIDLKIEHGRVRALVSGSSMYEVEIEIKPLAHKKWAISEFPKWRKYLISLSFRGQSSVRPVQVGGFDVNIVIHRSTAVRGRGGPARHDAWPPSLGAILAHTDGPCGS